MLDKPAVAESNITAAILDAYGIAIHTLVFLPVGADKDTFVFRGESSNDSRYFIKLRKGDFNELSVSLPVLLGEQGIAQVVPALRTVSGGLWANLECYKVMLYPFLHGVNGYEAALSTEQWVEFGRVVRKIQGLRLPELILRQVPKESFAPGFRNLVRIYLDQKTSQLLTGEAAKELNGLLVVNRHVITWLLERTEALAEQLKRSRPEMVLCHSDLHAGNILIGDHGTISIVDWDSPILAPPERDTMCAGSGLFGGFYSPEEEEAMFFKGYGAVETNPSALAYYRYERIIEDIAVECEQIFNCLGSEEDRRQALVFFKSNFQQGGTIEIAMRFENGQS